MQVSRARYILVITYSNQWRIPLITNLEFDFLATIVDIPHFSEYILDVQFNILLFIPSMHDISSTTKDTTRSWRTGSRLTENDGRYFPD